MALLPPDPRTCLSRTLSGTRRVAFSRPLPLADLRDRARRLGATVNELLIAAVAGALREVLVAAGDAPADVRALVPVNLRDRLPDAGTPLGNRFGLVFLQLPVGAADAAERLALVRARTAELKRSADAVVTWAVLAAVGHLPALEQLVIEFFARKASLVVTNVPGPRAPLHLAGREIGQIMFNVPHPGTLGLGVSVLSYAGGVTIGARADAAPMPDPGALVRGIAHAAETLR
jgi:diacylglycerol O-acyltransferase